MITTEALVKRRDPAWFFLFQERMSRDIAAERTCGARPGQYVMNELSWFRPDLVNRVTNTPVNPFYSDEVPDDGFWDWLMDVWES